jgi:uncharacterized protein
VDDLILSVDALEEADQPFEADLSREFLEEVLRAEPATEFHAAGAAHLRGRATKMGREVLARAKFTVPLRGHCKRCLKSVQLEEPVELVRAYVPAAELVPQRKRAGGDSEASFDPELVDEEGYQGKEIDLSSALREQILLSVPPSPLCDEQCKGLCPRCGKDLNEGECGCDRTVVDPRWAALKGIQLKKEK